jgi:hypothetical protein
LTKKFNFLSNDSVTRIAGKLDPQQENKNWTTLVGGKWLLKLYLKLCLKPERKVRCNRTIRLLTKIIPKSIDTV